MKKIYSAFIFLLLAGPVTALDITTNTTWDSPLAPIDIDDDVYIRDGAVLTVTPNTVVRFYPFVAVRVEEGALHADGAVFTSYPQEEGEEFQQWGSVNVQSEGSSFVNTAFRYGGLSLIGVSAEIRNCLFENVTSEAVILINNAAPLIQGCTFQFNNVGIRGEDTNMGPALIRNNLFRQNTVRAMGLMANVGEVSGNRIESNGLGIFFNGSGSPLVTGNTFYNNTRFVFLNSPDIFPRGLSSNTILGKPPGIEVRGGPMTQSGTWESGIPYIAGDAKIDVQPGVTLTLEPGAIVKQFPSRVFLNVYGRLIAQGTPENPIIFTARGDDSAGGDTDGNGNQVPEVWLSMDVRGEGSRFEYAEFRHMIVALGLYGASPEIRHCLFQGSISEAVFVANNAAPLIEGCTFQLCYAGVRGHDVNMGPAVIRNNLFQQSPSWAISLSGRVGEVSGNRIESSGYGIFFQGNGTPLLTGNTFYNNNVLMFLNSPNIFPQNLNSNTFIYAPGKLSAIEVNEGVMTQSGTWEAWMPYVLRRGVVRVEPGVQLTLQPGVVIKHEQNSSYLDIYGELDSQGTENNPVVFTSLRDDQSGGDTNGDGLNTAPQPGDWSHPLISEGDGSRFRNTQFKYGGRFNDGVLRLLGGSATVESCLFSLSSSDGVRIDNDATVTIAGSTFTNIGNLGVHNRSSNIILAAQNFWGHPSGPRDDSDDRATGGYYNPDGQGVRVSDRVNYVPWLGGYELRAATVSFAEGSLTPGRSVTLRLGIIGPVTQMIISENPDFSGATYEPFALEKEWMLSPGNGLKTIYVRYRTQDDVLSETVSASILFVESPPTASLAISPPSPVGPGLVQVTLTSSEKLQSLPALSFKPVGGADQPLVLTTHDFRVFTGTFAITNDLPNGTASFSFSGTDLSGNIGTEITAGGDFVIDTVSPSAPVLEGAVSLAEGKIRLNWQTAPEAESYAVYRATGAESVRLSTAAVASGLIALSYDDLPPVDGLYFYGVIAVDAAGNRSDFSNIVSTVSDRRVAPQVISVNLSPPSPVSVGPLSISVRFSKQMNTSVPLNVTVNGVAVTSTAYVNDTWNGILFISTQMANGNALLAVSNGISIEGKLMVSSAAVFVIDTAAPMPPTQVTASVQPNGTDLLLNWTASEPNVTYSVFRSTWNAFPASSRIASNQTDTNFVDSPPAVSSGIYYALTARDAAGNESVLSLSTSVASPFPPQITFPADGTRVDSLSVRVRGRAQPGVTVNIRTGAGLLVGSGSALVDRTFDFNVTLPQAGDITLQATASDAGGRMSAAGAPVTLTVDPKPSEIAAPTSEAGDTVVTLQWDPVEEEDLAGYWVYRDGNSFPINATLIPSDMSSFMDIGLTNGRSYQYRVAAQDETGQIGSLSPPVETVPQAGPSWGN